MDLARVAPEFRGTAVQRLAGLHRRGVLPDHPGRDEQPVDLSVLARFLWTGRRAEFNIFNDDYQRITRVISTRDNGEESYFAGVDLHLMKGLELSLGARHIISKRDQVLVPGRKVRVRTA